MQAPQYPTRRRITGHTAHTRAPGPLARLARLALLALWPAVATGNPAQADITVGAPFALSGPIAEQARAMRQGAELAAQQINQQGGVLGRPYRLVFADTACDPARAVDEVRRLLHDGALALVGPVCSGVTLRVARSVTIPAGVPLVSVASASSLISGLDDRDLVFRTAPSDALKGQALARLALDRGLRRIAISHAGDAYNTGVAQVFEQAFKAGGGEVSVLQSHAAHQADYQREARAVAAGATDLALFAYSGAGGVQYLKDVLAQPGMRQVLGTDGLMAAALAQQLGAEALSRLSFVLAAPDSSREGWRRWQAMAQAARLPADGPYVAHAYDATFLVALAIEAAGRADRAALAQGLRAVSGPAGTAVYPGEFAKARALIRQGVAVNYEGASGAVDFDAAGDVSGRLSLHRFVDGAWQVVGAVEPSPARPAGTSSPVQPTGGRAATPRPSTHRE